MSASVVVFVFMCACVGAVEDVCERCQCLPTGPNPTQALCAGHSADNKIFEAFTTEESHTLELVYIYNMDSVNLRESSLDTGHPLTLLIQNCSYVSIADRAVARLRTIIIRDAYSVQVGDVPGQDLWAVFLENIQQLEISSRMLAAGYSVNIGRINSLTLRHSQLDNCSFNEEYRFLLFNSKVQPIAKGGFALCGGKEITINGNTFTQIAEEGIQITSNGIVAIVYNQFDNITKQTFNISAPEIHITRNNFKNLPAGALRAISTYGDSFFTYNTIEDIDLGGVLLDMGMDMAVEENIINCDCASKTTSILNPKEDMVILTNSSLEKLDNIFLNNFCNLNCTLNLKDFSIALKSTEVCLTNETLLEEDILCQITTTSVDSFSTTETTLEEVESTSTSSAGRIEIIFPVGLVAVSIVLMVLLFYGCREIKMFRYKFDPNQPTKVSYVS